MSETTLEDIKQAVRGKQVRLDFGSTFAFGEGKARMVETVQVYVEGQTKGGNFKWIKLGPLILPPEGEGRGTLMEMITEWMKENA